MAPECDAATLAGQAAYTRTTLALYDVFVLGVSFRFIWKCPASRVLEFYNAHVSANHLECGAGTGYFLDRCAFPPNPSIALVDLNAACLAKTARRIARYRPRVYRRNLLQPLDLGKESFDSIAIHAVLHCLPGTIHTKAVVFDHLARHLNPGGILFGGTLLGGGVPRGRVARRLMEIYNRKGIFSNTQDDLVGLAEELARRFRESHVEVAGCAALFWARG